MRGAQLTVLSFLFNHDSDPDALPCSQPTVRLFVPYMYAYILIPHYPFFSSSRTRWRAAHGNEGDSEVNSEVLEAMFLYSLSKRCDCVFCVSYCNASYADFIEIELRLASIAGDDAHGDNLGDGKRRVTSSGISY